MYTNLIDINLKDYLDSYFFNEEWISEPYLENLDIFISKRCDDQKKILRKKFLSLNDLVSVNDHLYELMVCAALHPSGEFQHSDSTSPSPDIIDRGVNVEVKNINPPPEEIERIKDIIPDSIYVGPFPEDSHFESRIRDKFLHRVNKAKIQIKNKGIVYIIWDTTAKGSSVQKPKIEKLLSDLCEEQMRKCYGIKILTLYFEELRNMVAKKRFM